MGVGMPAVLYLAVPILINAWFCKRIGFNIGLCMAFTGVGGAIFNQLGNLIIQSAPDGWRRRCLTVGLIIQVAALPFTIFVVRSHPSDLDLQQNPRARANSTSGHAYPGFLILGDILRTDHH